MNVFTYLLRPGIAAHLQPGLRFDRVQETSYQEQNLRYWSSLPSLPGLREESESVTELKTASKSRLPAGTLMLGAEGIKNAISTFEDARKVDMQNERFI
ncbi:serine/threonine protein phosphatase 2B catalytic subunit [Drepanopeziza brunnea f. sp. 'multigermtubi' MB_m1]|uniref:Serine/threonine protein phosphatase 2B catalytic subunit n=1 Tax=Marssonina brunnea f. sp. multigermtubi (strain MB_m1) TaxID=1072389 RepID=K1XJ66_MARBU|nr:serine/threonine protein phosphatase 2B catalytic subunit [Drepanopeziza brunnea f. sp. 'multigermtubi' MB_m1]EKD12504.1 serine/threonine protein phosphatase 2B catalytic subunit [Drepanopeziza brunnea f. sp. 'multigermtubi' MB_m1]